MRGSWPFAFEVPLVLVLELVEEDEDGEEVVDDVGVEVTGWLGVVVTGALGVVGLGLGFGFEGVVLPNGSPYWQSLADLQLPWASAWAGNAKASAATSTASGRVSLIATLVAETARFAANLRRNYTARDAPDALARAMSGRRVLVTGAAGFVGSTVALRLQERHSDWELVGLDNLRRRGSELNLPRLRAAGVAFEHGDVRDLADLLPLGRFDAIVECSAEPSALSGVDGATDYVVKSNLLGAWHCLELARRHGSQIVFLSTSRVYPIAAINELAYEETGTRFVLRSEQAVPGASEHGISEAFPLAGARTLYGATKLSAELLIAEYAAAFGLPAAINRCGVIAGPWQMGKVDQGVFTHWLLAHHFRRPLQYIGFGGSGKQVRDLLHVDDLVELIEEQLADPEAWTGANFNVGGGAEISLSLRETSELCRELTGNEVEIGAADEDRPGDVRLYVSDCRALFGRTEWRPRRGAREILADIAAWVEEHEAELSAALG